jgi:hypothetical protein
MTMIRTRNRCRCRIGMVRGARTRPELAGQARSGTWPTKDCLSTLVLSECWGADGAQLVRQPRGDHRFWPFEVVAQPQMARILDLDRARAGR